MSNFIDNVFDNAKNIRVVASNLDILAASFNMVGNEHIYRILKSMSEKLLFSQDQITKAVSSEINRTCGSIKKGLNSNENA